VVLRGRRDIENAAQQYIGHSRHLIRQDYFEEVAATLGDQYVRRIARGDQGTGNSTTWRIAAIQRHVAVSASQVAAAVARYSQQLTPRT
jgi:hypothetical protein